MAVCVKFGDSCSRGVVEEESVFDLRFLEKRGTLTAPGEVLADGVRAAWPQDAGEKPFQQ